MSENQESFDVPFFQLTMSLHAAAMQQMGKVMNTSTGKIERDLAAAKASVDMLDMLQRKTQGNLSDDEKQLLERLLYEARMNYVDEAQKGDAPQESKADAESGEAPADPEPSAEEGNTESAEEPSESKD
ncbi:MAG: hypothetical protein DRP45_01200 [Candidatus Zixiibacteriota bacterium]|nr:MAG: hypothetical protein DRP45_01200 [candidate division Zixibacteria bacterium]